MQARKSFGPPYECKYNWDFFVQCGDSGVVFGNPSYTTAFFEAFPKSPSCFLRGEGATVEEAEENCWEKWQKVQECSHEMERRGRTDGYAYCKHCSYASTVFEPLTKCCKCKTPTAYSIDYKKNYYCKKHFRFRIKNPNPKKGLFGDIERSRCPRKMKKKLKTKAKIIFSREGYLSKIIFSVSCTNSIKMVCEDKSINILFSRQKNKILNTSTKKWQK